MTTDIFICSYPKSGTTWTQALVRALITMGRPPNEEDDSSDDWHITEYCPFYEADRTWRSQEGEGEEDGGPSDEPFAPLYVRRQRETGRRAYNTHLRWDMMPTEGSPEARFLYLVRDGRDVAASYFHHMRSMVRPFAHVMAVCFEALHRSVRSSFRRRALIRILASKPGACKAVEDGGFEGTWEAFFEAWCKGQVAFGAWIDHLMSWCGGPAATVRGACMNMHNRCMRGCERTNSVVSSNLPFHALQDPRVLFLRYEEMKADLRGTIAAIAKHIRIPLPTPTQVDRIAAQCGLEGMQRERQRYEPRSVQWRSPDFRFIRKGQVGDHAALFTPEQQARFACSLRARYAMAVSEGEMEGVVASRAAAARPGVALPAYVTGALVGGEAGLLRWVREGDGNKDRE